MEIELGIGEYGRCMFEMIAGKKYDLPSHWESIREKAEPLVRQLIALNAEMNNGGYQLYGYVNSDGKFVLPEHLRIAEARRRLWLVEVGSLKEGDRVWFDDIADIYLNTDLEPGYVEFMKGDFVYVREEEGIIRRLHSTTKVFKAPDDYGSKDYSDEYWLEQADKLGI